MSRSAYLAFLSFVAANFFLGVSFLEGTVWAQESQTFSVVTADGVKIKGSLYVGKKESPTVIMLHPIGEGKNSKAPEWKNLAEALQKAGYSVCTFDFRGHGESTSIDEKKIFWNVPNNRLSVKAKNQDEIDAKDFASSPGYMPVLVNDIAAIKAYLDRQHDEGNCNTSNTIVIGAEGGATLGAIWINSEFNRFRYTPASIGKLPQVASRPEGVDIIAAVFLTATPDIGKRKISLTNVLNSSCRERGVGAVFFYGEKDAKAKEYAKLLESKLKLKGSKKHDFIGGVEMPNTNLSGVKLLQKGLDTDVTITKYLEGLVAERTNEYVRRDKDAQYVWRLGAKYTPAKSKPAEQRTFHFNSYDAYAQ